MKNTTTLTGVYSTTESQSSAINVSLFSKEFWEKLNFSYYGVIPFTLIVGSCIGGIAAATVLAAHGATWQLAAVSFFSMFNNTTAIASMNIKWVSWSFVAGLVVNISMILVNAV